MWAWHGERINERNKLWRPEADLSGKGQVVGQYPQAQGFSEPPGEILG